MASPDTDMLHRHFSTLAPRYNDLRTTDPEPVDLIARCLDNLETVTAADVGCGTGRYTAELMDRLGDRLFVYCIDQNQAMLRQLCLSGASPGAARFRALQSRAEKLPLPNRSLDCLLTFNAVHHFNLHSFLREAERTLRPGGHLFIYTRFQSHNERGIWGRHFPGFAEKERRLYRQEDLHQAISSRQHLAAGDVILFRFRRAASVEYLLERVKNNHYSTFCFYEPEEKDRAAKEFEVSLRSKYRHANTIEWVDENVMFTARRL